MRSVFMRYPGGLAKALTFSYDDGILPDKRLAEIFDRYGMKATFNFTCRTKFSTDEEINEIFLSKGHEIAVHGANHRPNGNQRPIEGIRDVLDCRLELERRCGRIIRGMAYPDSGITFFGNFGNYEQVKNYLTELDIVYARTLAGDNDRFELPNDFHAWVPSAHHDNPEIMEYIDKFLSLDLSKKKMYHAKRHPRLLYIWGHSFELDNNDNWDHIEKICEKLSHNDEIWYATNIEIYEYVEGYKRLVYSADGTMVYNPSLFSVWIDVDGVLFEIAPGKTVTVG